MICMIVLGQMGAYGMDLNHRMELYVLMAALTVLAIYRHSANIKRLLDGTENKIYLSPERELKNLEVKDMAKISVLGAGSWGTALALLLYKNGHEVLLWSALEDEVKMLLEKREHEHKVPGVKLPEDMEITTDLKKSLEAPDVAVLAVPSPFTRKILRSRMAPYVREGQIIVNVAKGVKGKYSYDSERNHRAGNSCRRGGSAFRSRESCRRGGKRNPDYLCCKFS